MQKEILRTISFNDTGFKSLVHSQKILEKISKIIGSGVFLEGSENELLRKLLKKDLGKGYISTVASGHDALLLSLQALNLKSGDEVILPVNVYPTAFPVSLSGATLMPVDIDKNGQVNINELKRKITKRTKVIIMVHLYGLVGDIEKISVLCKEKRIILIEDCAQAWRSRFKKKIVGTWGNIGCFSFYPTKIWGTLGHGGAVWTKDKKVHEYIQMAKSYGEKERYQSEFVAGHSRLPEIQAGILTVFYPKLKKERVLRKKLFDYYQSKIHKQGLQRQVRVLESHPQSEHVSHLFVIEANKRDQLQRFLKKQGIQTHIHYPTPIHLLSAFKHLGYKKGDFPISEAMTKKLLSLPFHPAMKTQDIDYIVQCIKQFYG